METEQPTVVTAPVDAEQPVVIEQPAVTTDTGEKVVETAVDALKPDEKVGEAIKREVERREAQLKQKYEQESKTLAQQARDSAIAELGYTWNDKPITTEAELKQAKQEEAMWKQYRSQNQDLPDEVIQELIEGKTFREQYKAEKQTQAQKEKSEADFKAFFEAYPTIDPTKDIPANVWQEVDKGKSLLDAYVKHENQLLKEQLASVTAAKQIEQQNQDNALSSTGSVTGQGAAQLARYTRDQVAKMSESDVSKNWKAINESMKTWE